MAKRAVKKATGKNATGRQAVRKKNTAKKPIESYDHQDKRRANNPPVGLVTPDTDQGAGNQQIYEYDPHLDPRLVWAGKAEHTSFEVPTISLHVHERIDPRTIIEATRKRNGDGHGNGQMMLFEQPEQNPPLREAIEFCRHAKGWTNRLIAGDSLLVMNSLLEKEGMAGKVQMVYIDPPYGIMWMNPSCRRRSSGPLASPISPNGQTAARPATALLRTFPKAVMTPLRCKNPSATTTCEPP